MPGPTSRIRICATRIIYLVNIIYVHKHTHTDLGLCRHRKQRRSIQRGTMGAERWVRIMKNKAPAHRRSPYFHVVTRATGVPSPVHDYHPTRMKHQFLNLTLLARLGTHQQILSRLAFVATYVAQLRSPCSCQPCGYRFITSDIFC